MSPLLALLLVGLLQGAEWVDLAEPWGGLGSGPVLLALAAVLVAGFGGRRLARKVPGADGRPRAARLRVGMGWVASLVAGAILFDAHAGTHVAPLVSLGLGAGSSAVLHGARAAARRPVPSDNAERTHDVAGNVSAAGPIALLERVATVLLVLVAFSLPAFAGVVAIALSGGAWLDARRSRNN